MCANFKCDFLRTEEIGAQVKRYFYFSRQVKNSDGVD